jgi:hypothetical protein
MVGCGENSITNIGNFTGKDVEACSYYTQNLTKSSIEKFCEEKKAAFLEKPDHVKILWLEFSDDKKKTPKYENGMIGMNTSKDTHFIANYIYNSDDDSLSEVNFFKEML